MLPNFRPLYVIECLPSSLGQEVTPERAKELVQRSLLSQKLLQPSDLLEKFTSSVHRLVLAPYPLSLSIAKAFLPSVSEVIFDKSVIDPTDSMTRIVDGEAWLEQLGQSRKLRPCYIKDTLDCCFNMPPGKVTLTVVTTLFYQRTVNESSPPHYVIRWPIESYVREATKIDFEPIKKVTVALRNPRKVPQAKGIPSNEIQAALLARVQTIPVNPVQVVPPTQSQASLPNPVQENPARPVQNIPGKQVQAIPHTIQTPVSQAQAIPSALGQGVQPSQGIPPRRDQAMAPSQVPPEIVLTYLGDEEAARLHVKVMKSVMPLIQQKKGELEQLNKVQTVLSSVSESVLQGVREVTSQLQLKDLPPLQLPQLKLEEEDSLTQQMRLFGENSRQILTSLTDLKTALQSW